MLVEGGTDAAVLYGSGDRYHRGHLESLGIAVVPVGKSSIPLANEILNSLGIPTYALFDADGGYHARAHAKGKPTDKIEEEKSDHIRLNHRLLGYFGLTTNDFPEQQATEHVAVFSDVLETYLESQWPEWGKSFEDLEAQLGMPVRKNQQAYRVATRLTEGPIPEFLQQIFERISEKVGTIVRTGPES